MDKQVMKALFDVDMAIQKNTIFFRSNWRQALKVKYWVMKNRS